MRMQLTSLVKNGKVTTTPKRAKVLKAYADSFFSSLLSLYEKGDEAYAQREAIRMVKATIYGEEDGKKVIETLLPKYLAEGKKSGFVASYKMGFRVGDGAAKVMLKLV